jgi:hypothetical protein
MPKSPQRRDDSPNSDLGNAFLNLTKKSGLLQITQAIGQILGEDRKDLEMTLVMQNFSYSIDDHILN